MKMKAIGVAVAMAFTLGINAATFTGELYGYWYEDEDECEIYRIREEWKSDPSWRDDYVEVNSVKEPGVWGMDGYAFPVTITPGETFSAEILHGSSTAKHIKSVKVLSDDELYKKFRDSEEWNYDMSKLWSGGTVSTRAWVVVEQNNVTSGSTYSIDLSKWPIINDADLQMTKFYNPADGDGGLSSIWTIASYAKEFGVNLTGTRKVTESVWYKVKIKGGDEFPQRVWNVCDPFAKDYKALDKLDDNGGDQELFDAVGLFFITHDMVSGGSSSGDAVAIPKEWLKARVLKGVATRALPYPFDIQGFFELKCGKANKKTGIAKVSAKLTGIDGKKKSYKAQNVNVTGETVTVVLDSLTITIDGNTFFGTDGLNGGLGVYSAQIGGALADGSHTFQLLDLDFEIPGELQEDLLPWEAGFTSARGRWTFAKNASVKWKKDRETKQYGLVVDDSKGKTNLASLKLSYAAKTGAFKGGFKVYALEESKGRTKLKKYTVKVTGFVVDGSGAGRATCKSPSGGPWPVVVD